jgi:hypothetical protein
MSTNLLFGFRFPSCPPFDDCYPPARTPTSLTRPFATPRTSTWSWIELSTLSLTTIPLPGCARSNHFKPRCIYLSEKQYAGALPFITTLLRYNSWLSIYVFGARQERRPAQKQVRRPRCRCLAASLPPSVKRPVGFIYGQARRNEFRDEISPPIHFGAQSARTWSCCWRRSKNCRQDLIRSQRSSRWVETYMWCDAYP